ncbi:L-histidine N(alpha)-methyltransferase [Myceligenerans halotolerans]
MDDDGRVDDSHGAPRIEVLLTPQDRRRTLEADVLDGLTRTRKQLPPKYFYDAAGSELFEEITRLQEYYLTRAESALLHRYAAEIGHAAGAQVLLELGSGSSEKTRLLLDALAGDGHLAGYVPVDVSQAALGAAVAELRGEYPGLDVVGVVADFERHLADLPAPGRRTIAFLGSTLGNYSADGRRRWLRDLASGMAPGETLLLGLDLVKAPERLLAAYDDAAGVTAAFNRNVLHVLNRELDADFEPDAFDHVASWNEEESRIEMRLRAREAMEVKLTELDLVVRFSAGETLLTEYSSKFTRETAESDLRAAGFTPSRWWQDLAGDYALVLATL